MSADTYFKAMLVDGKLLDKDPHFSQGCSYCHKGNEAAKDKDGAHKGLRVRPSDDLNVCGACHPKITATFGKSLHYTTAGLKHGVSPRFTPVEREVFEKKVFEKSCRSCHASCGDCHVKGPTIGGVKIGLVKNHQFMKRPDESKTCAACHGGRVYPEFTGDYGEVLPDVHQQKGMTCVDCHGKDQLHGDGTAHKSMREVKERPDCRNCHQIGEEKNEQTRLAHRQHKDKLSCQACHASAAYRNCYDCHDKKSQSKPGFFLGLSPRDHKTITTLRLIPTVRDTFKKDGIAMENFDALPNYWDTPVHNIRKRTDRTKSCEICHRDAKDFLSEKDMFPGGSKANNRLIYKPKPLK
ncbi:MAG: multiheme c-type cytochrome [Smithellaceae bacterium]|nr:multiheme c-type cytochrome [Smithellaceae bacterium]